MSPEEWLKQIRLAAGYEKRFLPINTILDTILCRYGRIPDGIKPILSKYESMTQGDADDRLSEIISKLILNIIPENLKEEASKVFIGIYPTYEAYGYSTTTPRGDKVIMLHSGLFLSLSLLSNLLSLEFERVNKEIIIENEILIEYIAYVSSLWNKDLKKSYHLPQVNPKTNKYILCSSVLCISSMIFILGHEFGHVIEQHYSYDPTNQEMNHNMEYQADKWGAKLLIRHMMFNEIPVEYFSYTLMSFFLTLGMYAMISNKESNTHPSAQNRLQRIKKQLPIILKEEAKSAGYMGGEVISQRGNQIFNSIGDTIFDKHIHYGNISKILQRNTI